MKFVQSEKPLATEHKTLGDISVAVEVPQIEGDGEAFWNEYVAFCGTEAVAKDFLNKQISDVARRAGGVALRAIPEDGVLADATPRIQNIVRGFTPQSSDGRETRAKKVQVFDSIDALLASGAEFTKEQLVAMLQGAK